MSNISRFQFEQMQERLARAGARTGPAGEPPLEKKLHEEIMQYCDTQWPRWKYVHSRMDKATRNERGVPDFVIALPGNKTIYVEAKRIGEKVSPAQRDWHAEMAKLGHTVFVVHDLLEFVTIIEHQTTKPK